MWSTSLIAVVLCLSVAHVYAACDATCSGTDSIISCLYCPNECGTCAEKRVITKCRDPGTVHLTMDDEPFGNSNAILDILKAKGVNATFFVLGVNIDGKEGVIRRMLSEGHNVGAHSYSHGHMNAMNDEQLDTQFVNTELGLTKSKIQNAAGMTPPLVVNTYRPPYGELNNRVYQRVTAQGYQAVLWNADLNDWTEDTAQIHANLDFLVRNNDPRTSSFMLLYHAAAPVALATLPSAIDGFRAAGYRFVSAEQCYLAPSAPPSNPGGNSSAATLHSGASLLVALLLAITLRNVAH